METPPPLEGVVVLHRVCSLTKRNGNMEYTHCEHKPPGVCSLTKRNGNSEISNRTGKGGGGLQPN